LRAGCKYLTAYSKLKDQLQGLSLAGGIQGKLRSDYMAHCYCPGQFKYRLIIEPSWTLFWQLKPMQLMTVGRETRQGELQLY